MLNIISLVFNLYQNVFSKQFKIYDFYESEDSSKDQSKNFTRDTPETPRRHPRDSRRLMSRSSKKRLKVVWVVVSLYLLQMNAKKNTLKATKL